MTYQTEILAIDESHFVKFIEAEKAMMDKLMTLDARSISGEEDETSRLLQMIDKVGLINISGMLVNDDNYWNRYYGRVSYNEIREAIIDGIEAGANTFVFNIDSPGGRVSGLSDIAEFMSKLPQKTFSFTSSRMASAAYFLGSQTNKVYADSFSEVGSVGVIVKMYDRSKMLADMGVKPIRFRSGKLKAAGDGDFKLTKEESNYIEGQVKNYAGKFYQIVSDARGIPLQLLEKTGVTSGRTFIGQEAMDVNLVDKIKSFDQVMQEAFQVSKKVDKGFNNGVFSR